MRKKSSNPSFEDLSRFASGALGAISEARAHLRKLVREAVDRVVEEMDLVSRKEYEALESMVRRSREVQAELQERLRAYEQRATAKIRKAHSKPAARKNAGKKGGKKK